MGLTAAEIMAHPAYNTVEWDLPPTKQGTSQVAKGRPGGPFNLYWEVHGTGDIKLVVSCTSSLSRQDPSLHHEMSARITYQLH